ncbi:MAG TPA: hypothetical protein VMF08_19835 [Candidatus Sulfotelmatobacter sp.]|nr:hypothetical protein [Candidatus Sulfotelmatobacter sp.]
MAESRNPVEEKQPVETEGHLQGATGQQGTIAVTRHPISALHIYEVTEQDLAVLRRGSFLRALLTLLIGVSSSTVVSLIIVLYTVTIGSPKVYASFVGVVLVCAFILLCSIAGWIYVEKAEIGPARERIEKK